MPYDVPSDVQAVLTQLLEETEVALRAGEHDTARQLIQTATTVTQNKLPEGELRGQVLHGCGEVIAALEADAEPALAPEYVRAMTRRLPEQ